MDLWAVVPEMILAGLALALVPLAPFLRGRWRMAPAVAVMAGLAGSMIATAAMWQLDAAGAFCGTYVIDRFGTLYKLMLEAAALVSTAMLASHFRGHAQEAHAPLPLLFATIGGLGLVSSMDLGLILLFLQILSIASYLLVMLVRTEKRAQEACLKYFIYAAVVLAIMGYGLTFLFGLTGSLELRAIGASLQGASKAWVVVAFGLVFIGYAFEITLVPFQFWAPDVYQGATAPVAGFISVVPKIAAFAALMRFLMNGFAAHADAWPLFIATIAAVTMTAGNLAALRQQGLKRLLAYSSIAQAGYLLMAVAVVPFAASAAGALGFYLAAYLSMNLAAFLVVGVVERHVGSDSRKVLRGLARRTPWLAAVMVLALLSLAGIPPLAGFAGKVFILTAAIDGGMPWLAAIAAVNMAIGLYYYALLLADMFFYPAHDNARFEVSIGYAGAAVVTSAGTVVLGIVPDFGLGLATAASWLQ